MPGINWGQSAATFGSLFLEQMRRGQEQREEEEAIRKLMEQQYQQAEALRASGTVPPSFGGLLQSIQPPSPAPPPTPGLMGTLGQVFGDFGRGGRRRSPASLLQEESQQHTLDAVFKEAERMREERERERREGEREMALEKRRAATQADLAARQQAGFTHAEEMQTKSLREMDARQIEREAAQQRMETQREAARVAQQTAAEKVKEKAADLKILKGLRIDGVQTQEQVDIWNELLDKYPQAGLKKKKWVPGSFFQSGYAKDEGPSSSGREAGEKSPADMTDEELRRQFQ